MAKQDKPKKQRPENYDPKLKVKGSFLDVMKAAVKDAKSKDKILFKYKGTT